MTDDGQALLLLQPTAYSRYQHSLIIKWRRLCIVDACVCAAFGGIVVCVCDPAAYSHQRSAIASIIIKVAAVPSHFYPFSARTLPLGDDADDVPLIRLIFLPLRPIIHTCSPLSRLFFVFFFDSPSHKERGIVYRGSYRALNISSLCKTGGGGNKKEEGDGGGRLIYKERYRLFSERLLYYLLYIHTIWMKWTWLEVEGKAIKWTGNSVPLMWRHLIYIYINVMAPAEQTAIHTSRTKPRNWKNAIEWIEQIGQLYYIL